MTTANDVIKKIKDNDIKYVDFRFTDPRGKWQHVTFDVSIIDADALVEGIAFDGSSIAGWKAINESDMLLIPDLATATLDPFFAASTLVLVCNVVEPTTGARYNRDPRGIARKAEEYLKSTGVGDTAFFGPEAEFFVFDDVRFSADPYNTGFSVDSSELPSNSATAYEGGNLGHRVRTKGGYFPVPPVELRSGHARRDARRHGRDGRLRRKAPSRGRLGPARTRSEIRDSGHRRRPSANL